MIKRRIIYAIVIGLIVVLTSLYFLFFMPREHIYNGTLATRTERNVL